MSETTITQRPDPKGFTSDPFTKVLRDGARKLIEQAIHAELDSLMSAFSGKRLEDGRAPGPSWSLARARSDDRHRAGACKGATCAGSGTGEDKITFTPSILPRYLRKANR